MVFPVGLSVFLGKSVLKNITALKTADKNKEALKTKLCY